jgi:K+-sensing histidine kinase KdpD
VEVTVLDRGPGIAADETELIFERSTAPTPLRDWRAAQASA